MSHIQLKDINRFECKFMPVPYIGCWVWIAKLTKGYGQFRFNKRLIGAHRFSYQLYRGEIPKGLLVCHHCDNPMCVNPDHLFLGTDGDNHKDRARKGRNNNQNGERSPSHKLSENDVIEIFHSDKKNADLAKQFNVSLTSIYRIKNGKKWKYLNLTKTT